MPKIFAAKKHATVHVIGLSPATKLISFTNHLTNMAVDTKTMYMVPIVQDVHEEYCYFQIGSFRSDVPSIKSNDVTLKDSIFVST